MDSEVSTPRVSVVIPTRGRPAALAACLAALARTTLEPAEMEVVVVGDGHDVRPPRPGAAGPFEVVWRSQARSGPAAARNLGARIASAPAIAFVDDDCLVTPQWAERMLARVEAEPSAIVAGRVRNGLPQNPWATASHLVLEVVIEMYNGRPGVPGFAPTSNLAMSRDVFMALGGLDERFRTAAAEDRDFCDRSFHAGHPLVLEDAAVVDHHHDLDMRGFVRQAAAYGRGEVTYRRACAESGRLPNLVRQSFYLRLVLAALAHGPRRGVALVLRAAASQAVFLASYWTAMARRPAR
jgi:GT2 family glycosyltransferase